MRALILAAGQGARMRSHSVRPKCLLKLGDETLLCRALKNVLAQNLSPVVVVGYRHDQIREHVVGLGLGSKVEFVYNPRFRDGSVLSFFLGLHNWNEGVVAIDADVYFDPELLRKLTRSSHESALLIDTAFGFTDEEFTAGVRGSRVLELKRGQVVGYEKTGVWVGLTKLGPRGAEAFRKLLQEHIEAGNISIGYEDALAGLLPRYPIGCELADGLTWIEIDFPRDYDQAQKLAAERA